MPYDIVRVANNCAKTRLRRMQRACLYRPRRSLCLSSNFEASHSFQTQERLNCYGHSDASASSVAVST